MLKRTPIATIPLTPALRYALMIGREAPEPIFGWFALQELRDAASGDLRAALAPAWAQHRTTLERETAGFEAWAVRQRKPRGPAVEQWRTDFLRAHRRQIPAPSHRDGDAL